MTEEEIQALQTALEEKTNELANLTAERDSLKEENEKLSGEMKEREKELAETKKLNFTLARQVDRGPKAGVEEVINSLFK